MEVQLALLLARRHLSADNLGDVLEGSQDRRDHPFVGTIDPVANGKALTAIELRFNPLNENREMLDKVEDTLAAPNGGFCRIDRLDLLGLRVLGNC